MGRPFVSIRYHFVWSTRGRQPLLSDALAHGVYACVQAKCAELGVAPLAVGGVEDHMHLLVGAPASLAPSTLIGQVKGVSSHLLNHALAATDPFAWQRGYGVFTVSRDHEALVRAYVLGQRLHHNRATLWPELERCDDET